MGTCLSCPKAGAHVKAYYLDRRRIPPDFPPRGNTPQYSTASHRNPSTCHFIFRGEAPILQISVPDASLSSQLLSKCQVINFSLVCDLKDRLRKHSRQKCLHRYFLTPRFRPRIKELTCVFGVARPPRSLANSNSNTRAATHCARLHHSD